MSKRDHLESVERQTGHTPDGLIPPEFPYEFEWVFKTYLELSGGRSSNGMGASTLSWQDIHAYCSLKGLHFSDEEFSVINALEATYMDCVNDASVKAKQKADTSDGGKRRHHPQR